LNQEDGFNSELEDIMEDSEVIIQNEILGEK
jgi:hypothetical protein